MRVPVKSLTAGSCPTHSGCHWLISPHTEIQQLVGIFLPIGAFLTPERAGARVIEDLVRRLYRRLEQDGILAPAPAS